LVVVCGLALAAGFFFAGLQHFTAMGYGLKNSTLRKQVESLEAEKRRLLLAKEVTLSPREIRKAARGVNTRNAELVRAKQPANAPEPDAATPGNGVKTTASVAAVNAKPSEKLVVPTVKSVPADRGSADSRRGRTSKDKKDKFEITSGRCMLASDGGSAEVVLAVILLASYGGAAFQRAGLILAMRPGRTRP